MREREAWIGGSLVVSFLTKSNTKYYYITPGYTFPGHTSTHFPSILRQLKYEFSIKWTKFILFPLSLFFMCCHVNEIITTSK